MGMDATGRAGIAADVNSHYGRCVLIPRDPAVFGTLSDEIRYGQRRQQAMRTMLILPNGDKLNLMGMDATDGAAIAASALDVLGSLGRGARNSGTQISIGGAAADNVGPVGKRIIRREPNVQPTLEQAVGHPVTLMVDRTITMGCYG
jgi:type IV secretory pathway VirB10-like protein